MAKTPTDIRSKARSYTDSAIRVLVEIMEDRSAPHAARVSAATEIMNRGLGRLVDPQRFEPVRQKYYVYSVHSSSGHLIYIGKGTDRRHLQSAYRLSGKSRVRAEFGSEKDALSFERRLIRRFKPSANIVYNRTA